MANQPNFASDNPYQVLGLTDNTDPTKADVKRAYRKLAMQYHPDVAVSTDKELSSARFAKINTAYREALERLERGESPSSYRTKTASSSSSSSSGGGGGTWQPPHRRSGSYQGASTTNSSPYASTDWRDYMPKKENDEVYDTKGDSFEKIFADMFASGATGTMSFVSDFLDFFESNFDGYRSSSEMPDDPDLQAIIRSGSVAEVKAEMEETELVVRQLTTKLGAIRQELESSQQGQSQPTMRYSERVQNQERIAELGAQRNVVDGYVSTAQRRLLALQNRYKELKQRQQGSSGRYDAQPTSWNDVRTSAAASSSSTSGTGYTTTANHNNNNSASSNTSSSGNSSAQDESWKSEGFGTYGRRSSSSRRSSSRATSGTAPHSSSSTTSASSSNASQQQQQSYGSPPRSERRPPPPPASSSSSSSSTGTVSSTSRSSDVTVPPHRRPAVTVPNYRDKVENERRLREIKVDEEFEKLKSELGLP